MSPSVAEQFSHLAVRGQVSGFWLSVNIGDFVCIMSSEGYFLPTEVSKDLSVNMGPLLPSINSLQLAPEVTVLGSIWDPGSNRLPGEGSFADSHPEIPEPELLSMLQ